jgi:hypothetical protein
MVTAVDASFSRATLCACRQAQGRSGAGSSHHVIYHTCSTSPHGRSSSCCTCSTYAGATRGLPLNAEHFIEFTASGVQAGNEASKLPGFIRELLQLKQCTFDAAAARITEIGINKNNERIWRDVEPGVNCISVGPWQTTLWALWCFLTNPDSYVGCVATAIAAGGDVDTTAAISGGIAGARVGAAGKKFCAA